MHLSSMHVRYLQHEHSGTVQLLLMPLSTATNSFKSTKWKTDENEDDCDYVPLPIQTFLWRQTNPFLGAKIGKLHEASCVTFERVVVQNILHGLSPSLSDALVSVSRWKLIKAALPHVIQCCGSLLRENIGEKKIPTSLQKILYILHWMLIDSSGECNDTEENTINQRSQGLFDISTIQLFVYLIAPLIDVVTEEELSKNIRLESGFHLWQALQQYRQPNIWCFSAPVKQRKNELPIINLIKQNKTEINTKTNQGIYLGEEAPRRPSVIPPPKPPRTDITVLNEKKRKELNEMKRKEDENMKRRKVESEAVPRTCSIVRSVSDYKASSEHMKMPMCHTKHDIKKRSSTDSLTEMMTDNKIDLYANENGSFSGIINTATNDAPLANMSDISSGYSIEETNVQKNTSSMIRQRAPPLVLTRASTKEDVNSHCSHDKPRSISPIVAPIIKRDIDTSSCNEDEELIESRSNDPRVASFFDVAVIRALLISHWNENGVYWGLRYILNRLETIQVYQKTLKKSRKRSNSLPAAERKCSPSIDQNSMTTWDDLKIVAQDHHVAFTDCCSTQKLSNDLSSKSSRCNSQQKLSHNKRNNSNPSLNTSMQGLSIKEDSENGDDGSNISSKSLIEKDNDTAVYFPETLGSSNFIDASGNLSPTVIVQTVNQVMDRCTGTKECELALNIADVLIRTPMQQPEQFFIQLNIMVFKIYLCLGCPYGCNEGVKSQHGDFLRLKAKSILANLERVHPAKFQTILNNYVENYGCQQVVDLLHSITAFCRCEISKEHAMRRLSESRMPSYRNKFNEKEKGIEGLIVSATLKSLISKLSVIVEELSLPENMSLQQDVRMFINFAQEQHGNPFRRVGLSALLDGLNSSTSGHNGKLMAKSCGEKSDQASLRRGLFKKKEKSGGTTTGNDDSESDSTPSTPKTTSSLDDGSSGTHPGFKKKSAPKLYFAFNLLKSVRSDYDEELSDSDMNEESDDFKAPLRQSVKSKIRIPMDTKGGIRLWGAYIPPPNEINIKGISEGAKRFAFMLESSKPGTFPDPPLISALLRLKSPVIARATLLIECCNFVSRCNRGEWPEWIRSSHHRTFSLGGPLANRGTPSATRRMHSIQRLAGRYFYHWAVQIGEQLSKIIELREISNHKKLKMEDTMEDFLDDGMVNDTSGERCPLALQLIAVLLLEEITSFLRETFKTIPRSRNTKNAGGSSGWDKLLNHRRWSILSNTFNAQQTGSVNSITDINSSIRLNDKERRISLSAAEEESPRGSKDAIDEISAVDKKGRRIATGRQRLLKRGSPMAPNGGNSLESSHKRRSLKIRKPSKQIYIEDEEKSEPGFSVRESLKPAEESVQPNVEIVHPTNYSQSHGSSHSQPTASKSHIDDEEQHMLTIMPWLKTVIKFANSFDLNCKHEMFCTPKCFHRVHRQSFRLIEALSSIYGLERTKPLLNKRKLLTDQWRIKQQALRRSIHARQSTAAPRRESGLITQPEFTSKAIKALLMEKMMQEKEKEKEKEEKETQKKSSCENDDISEQPEDDSDLSEGCNKKMISYLKNYVLKLTHSPISTVLKSALILNAEQYKQMLAISWKLLIHHDSHVVGSAASMFIISCVRHSEEALTIIKTSLMSNNVDEKTESIQRFYALWRNRFHVWLKMEEGSQASFKVPPPGIDFTLPSPPIGQSQLPVVDPPWMPHLKTKIEELSLKEEEHATSQTIMTMTRTRRKQKQEMVKKAVREAEERESEQRQHFRIRSSAIISLAAYEPALFHHQQEQSEEAETMHQHNRHVIPVAQPLFPSSLLSIVPIIVEMLDDPQVDRNGVSVSDVAKKVIWTCIVEDSSLFLRHFLEKLTTRDRQVLINEFSPTPAYEALISQLRKLILRFHPLPSQTAHSLLNYLFGFVMHYVRAQCEGSEKAIGMALSLCWLLSPNIHGLYFKDLKQTLKKEQCDQALMITANVPSTKKIIVHGLDSSSGGIPSQFPVHEDTQFHQILNDSLEFFNIEEDGINCYYLTDTKTGVIHMPYSYVRDYYFFHRSFYPQLSLVKLTPEEAHRRMRETTFHQRFIEVGKVLLTHNILKYSPQNVIAQRVFFLHDEFTHLPSFPRKSLETCFGMFHGQMGGQLKAMEAMHKFVWAKLMSDMFEKMENAFMFADLHLFINVINGIMIMHCEDVLILRRCAATYISISIHFNTLFASQGFFLIMPTLLRCYSQRQTNRIFCSVIEYICRQFYTLHRKPFLLQMCGAIANIMDNNNSDFEINPMRVKAKYWFNLIKKMEEITDEDPLDILGLVPYEKPLKALDLCYRDDPNTFCVLTDVMASCICVCAFAPESKRSHHMLLIMQALLPHMMKKLEKETLLMENSSSAIKNEINQWITMSVEMKALINSCETLARGPQRTFDLVNTVSDRGKSFVADSPQFFDPPTTNDDENVKSYNMKEKKSTTIGWEAAEVEEQHKEAYRRPRDILLQLSATYIETASIRLKELSKLGANLEHSKIPEVLDHKCYVKLGEIALALLKIAPYDLSSMSCLGLQKFFQSILPVTDWSIESNRSALNIILRRLDKTLIKIAKRQSFRRRVNWNALSVWIHGICDTLNAFPYIAHLHPLKTITQLCLRIMVGDPCVDDGPTASSHHPSTVLHSSTPPQTFSNCVHRLTTTLMQTLGHFAFPLEFVTSTEGMGVSSERLEAVLCHVVIPLFLRIYNNPKEQSIFQTKDLAQFLTMIQNSISPPLTKPSTTPLISTSTLTTSFIRGAQDVSGRQGSVSVTDRGHSATVSTHRIVRESVCQCIYLGLKVLMLTFGKLLTTVWPKVSRIVKDLLAKKPGALSALSFVDFLLQSNLPIALFILPMIQNKMKQKPTNEQEATWQAEILEKIKNKHHVTTPISVLIVKCQNELVQLREDLSSKPMEMGRSYTPTMIDPHSDSSVASAIPRSTSSRQSIDRRPSLYAKKTLSTMKEDSAILEDGEDEDKTVESSRTASPMGRVTKSPSVPVGKLVQSARTRSIGGFGMWRSVKRRSRHPSTDDMSDNSASIELHEISSNPQKLLSLQRSADSQKRNRQSCETLVLPLHETIDSNRQRFVSFSTPKKSHESDDNMFQITEQHQLV